MTHQPPPDAADAETLPARLDGLYSIIAAEVQGLTEAQLDFRSDRWRWSEWSIRRQLGHMTSAIMGWLMGWWGSQLFPNGVPEQYQAIAALSPRDRMDYFAKGDITVLLGNIRQAVDMARELLARETAESLRSRRISVQLSANWASMAQAHATGVTQDAKDPALWHVTLEATFRHLYYEESTHLYNIQRLKRAQGLATQVQIPFEGYWALESWDRSEP